MSSILWPPWTIACRVLCPSLSPRVGSDSCPLSRWCYPTILSSVAPSPFAVNLSQHQGLFQWVSSSQQVARVLKLQLQHQSFQWIFRVDFLLDGLVGSPCCSRDSQESSPAPQFKSISSTALSLLYDLTLTSVHDYWKKHSFDYKDICQQMMSLFFNTLSRFVIVFLFRSKHLRDTLTSSLFIGHWGCFLFNHTTKSSFAFHFQRFLLV